MNGKVVVCILKVGAKEIAKLYVSSKSKEILDGKKGIKDVACDVIDDVKVIGKSAGNGVSKITNKIQKTKKSFCYNLEIICDLYRKKKISENVMNFLVKELELYKDVFANSPALFNKHFNEIIKLKDSDKLEDTYSVKAYINSRNAFINSLNKKDSQSESC